ncbi:DUF2971 domain-containing protein [Vibrio owensii]|uniref:DUF2971 domain-containing protein n=1 Tax=Vibrio owensii TaxID=696485 RepID=UPI000998A6DE|nr:DUF2971 domain-containing protein [Vibrio owensii]AQW59350.1 hypothetical protein A9237_15405 [Vibrio owensii]
MEDDLVYHYTTAEGVLGILQSSSYWATQIDYLNDKSEYLSGLNMVNDLVRPVYFSNRKELMSYSDEEMRLKGLDGYIEYRDIALLADKMLGGMPSEIGIYSASFTSEKDSVKHWMAYTKANDAYSIGLSRKELFSEFNNSHNMFRSVSYNNQSNENLIARRAVVELLKAYGDFKIVAPFVSKRKCRHSVNERIQAAQYYLEVLMKVHMYACFVKHNSFSHESEARLVTTHISEDLLGSPRFIGTRDYPICKNSSDVFYRASSGLLIPTKSIHIPRSAIKKIIVGPHYSQELAAKSTLSLSRKLGYSVSVECSQVPLRYI